MTTQSEAWHSLTTQSEAWHSLTNGCSEDVSDGDLMQAYAEVNNTLHGLKRMGQDGVHTRGLAEWSELISQIQSDRQAAKRPKLPSKVSITLQNGHATFHMASGSEWGTGPNEQTEQLMKQLEAVYETTTMEKR